MSIGVFKPRKFDLGIKIKFNDHTGYNEASETKINVCETVFLKNTQHYVKLLRKNKTIQF